MVTRVIRSRRPERYGDIKDNVSKSTGKRSKFTISGFQSALTVPFLSADLCLGVVNMAHFNPDFYTKKDEEFAESVTRVTANTLVTLKAQRFLKGLLELVNDLVHSHSIPNEALLARAFALLHDFTGYARLLYLVPPAGETEAAWRVERVIGDDGQPLTEDEVRRWREHIIATWAGNFLRRTLLPGSPMYTNTGADIMSDESFNIRAEAAEAMAVVHLHPQHAGVPTGMIALLFLLPEATNAFQREQLTTFSHFIGVLIETQGNFKRLLDEKNLAEQEAMLGRTISQFRHSLRNQLGRLDTALDNAQDESGGSPSLQAARAIVREISRESENARKLVKIPENRDFDMCEVWNRVITKLSTLAQSRKIVLREWAHSAPWQWNSDPDIIEVIFEHLVQNSVEQGRPGDFVELQVESFTDRLCLTVRDSGPGIHNSIRSRLFESGVTTKSSGTGFGLHYSRRRARDLGGDLVFERDYRDGTAFSLILPR